MCLNSGMKVFIRLMNVVITKWDVRSVARLDRMVYLGKKKIL